MGVDAGEVSDAVFDVAMVAELLISKFSSYGITKLMSCDFGEISTLIDLYSDSNSLTLSVVLAGSI